MCLTSILSPIPENITACSPVESPDLKAVTLMFLALLLKA